MAGWKAGDTLHAGAYEVEKILGEGAMGVVLQARDCRLDRSVALKVLHEGLLNHPTARERMFREAQALARIDHPNVVRIHNVFEEGGALVLDLPLITGGSLEDKLKQGTVSFPEWLRMATGILEGLEELHQAGLVHRDLKPANVLIDKRGTPKIADLGVAHDAVGKGITRYGTQHGALLGTLEYMSPEQVRRRPVDGRSDLYSAGILFYELLIGEVPFSGDDEYEISKGHIEKSPDLDRLPPEIPSAIRTWLARALQKTPEERFQSAKEMAIGLDQAQSEPVLEDAPTTRVTSTPTAGVRIVPEVKREQAARKPPEQGERKGMRDKASALTPGKGGQQEKRRAPPKAPTSARKPNGDKKAFNRLHATILALLFAFVASYPLWSVNKQAADKRHAIANPLAEPPKAKPPSTTREPKAKPPSTTREPKKEKTDPPKKRTATKIERRAAKVESPKKKSPGKNRARSDRKGRRAEPRKKKPPPYTDEEAEQLASEEIAREKAAKKRAADLELEREIEEEDRRLREKEVKAELNLPADSSPGEIHTVVRQKQRTFQLCYEAMHTYDRLPKTIVQTSWQIMPNGTVKMRQKVTGGNLNREAKICIERALQSMKFPRQRTTQLVDFQVKLKTYP